MTSGGLENVCDKLLLESLIGRYEEIYYGEELEGVT